MFEYYSREKLNLPFQGEYLQDGRMFTGLWN